MKKIVMLCFLVASISTVFAQKLDDVIPDSRVFELAMVELVIEPTLYNDGKIKVLDLTKYSDPLCRTCWKTIVLSQNYWLQIAGQPSKAKLSDVVDLNQQVGAVFITKSNKVGRVSYSELLLKQKPTPSTL